MTKGTRFLRLAEKHFHLAVSKYTDAIAANPNNPVYYSNRAFAHIKVEEYGSAIEDATKAIELDPKFIKVILRPSK